MPARKNSKSSPRSIKRMARIRAALEYRREGYSYDEIVEFMAEDHPREKIYKSLVYSWVQAGMREIIDEPALSNFKLDIERLDALFRAAYANAIKGDIQSIGACLGILDRRAKMYGYDALGDDSADEAIRPISIQFVDQRAPARVINPPAEPGADATADAG